MEIYQDESRTTTLISSRGNFATTPDRRDDHKGGTRRTMSGALKSWTVYHKYEESISITQINQTDLETLEDIIENKTTVYYCPDTDKRNAELYTVKISSPVEASYDEVTGKYDMIIKVREV